MVVKYKRSKSRVMLAWDNTAGPVRIRVLQDGEQRNQSIAQNGTKAIHEGVDPNASYEYRLVCDAGGGQEAIAVLRVPSWREDQAALTRDHARRAAWAFHAWRRLTTIASPWAIASFLLFLGCLLWLVVTYA